MAVLVKIKVTKLKGGECLAEPIILDSGTVLIYENTSIKKEYIGRLVDLGVKYVYIKEILPQKDNLEYSTFLFQTELRKTYRNTVKDILEKHMPTNIKSLAGIINIAEDIIDEVLTHKEMVDKIMDIKERDPDIYEHSLNVCALSVIIGIKYGLSMTAIYEIAIGSIIHDLGFRYMSVPYENREISDGTPEEINEYKKHSIYGYVAIEEEDWLSETSKSIILSHHERLDGSGYPLKLRTIGIENKIVGLCDVFDCMICGIGYRQRKVYEAIEEIKGNIGKLYDAQVSEIFLSFIALYPVGTIVKTNEGETAVVIRQNEGFNERPIIRIIKDKNGNNMKKGTEKNMMKLLTIFIEEIL